MTRPLRMLDACCCQGAASKGYSNAGWQMTGIDNQNQPRYPYPFILGDALEYMRDFWWLYDAIHISPPCQFHTKAQRIQKNQHPELITPAREILKDLPIPWVIENVDEAAPYMRNPVMLCGAMFPGLRTYRHRLFESNINLTVPRPPRSQVDPKECGWDHLTPITKMGRPTEPGHFMHVVGHFSGARAGSEAMGGLDWMTRDGMREAIPPAYSEWIGQQLMAAVLEEAA